jgi:putative DNA primase/helicase
VGIGNMLAMGRSESLIASTFHAFDCDPFVFNVENGTIDLRTGALGPHRQEDMITKLAPVIYDAQAVAPMWEHFLKRVLPDPAVRAWVQRYVGYSLTGDVREQVLAFAYGNGANGKSVLLDVMLGIVGEYGHRSDPELLLAKQGETHQTGTADLEGKRIVVASEIEHNRAWGESMIKRITGDTTITARKMRMDFYTFNATHKLWIAANTKPKVHGTDNGIWRRMRLVPFEVTIPPEEQDKGLVAKLLATEASGILAWAVRGCLAWQAEGLTVPAAIAAATAGYRADQDVLGHWIEEECIVVSGAWAGTTELYENYRRWCEREDRHALSRGSLRERLLERPGISEHRKTGARGMRGIGLATDRQDHQPAYAHDA